MSDQGLRNTYVKIKAATLLTAAVLIAATPAKALDSNEENIAKVTTGMFIVGFLCDGYTPLADVMQGLAYRSVGESRGDRIMKAVGARVMARIPVGGAKPVAARLDPEVSHIVDEALDGFMSGNDREATCRQLGDQAVKAGVAARAH
jgi:hypothetical protein